MTSVPAPIPSGLVAALYASVYPHTTWRFLGCISNEQARLHISSSAVLLAVLRSRLAETVQPALIQLSVATAQPSQILNIVFPESDVQDQVRQPTMLGLIYWLACELHRRFSAVTWWFGRGGNMRWAP